MHTFKPKKTERFGNVIFTSDTQVWKVTNFNGEGGINSGSSKIERLEDRQKINVSAYLKTTVKLLQSDDPHELAVGLIAASGRRSIEILARGNFSEVTELPELFKAWIFCKISRSS